MIVFWRIPSKRKGQMGLDDTVLTQQLWVMWLLITTALSVSSEKLLPQMNWITSSLSSSPPVTESWQPHYSSIVRQNVIECE